MDFKILRQNAKELCKKYKVNIYIEPKQIEIYGLTFFADLKIRNVHGQWFEVKDYDEMWQIIQILV